MINNIFWGFALILLGLSLVVKSIFGITIPFMRALFGALFIYAGVIMVTGITSYNQKKTKISFFTQETIAVNAAVNSYNIILGQGLIDLRSINLEDIRTLDINVLLGSGELKIPQDIPITIIAESAVGGLQMPDETVINWGKKKMIPKNGKPAQLVIRAKAVLGNLIISYA